MIRAFWIAVAVAIAVAIPTDQGPPHADPGSGSTGSTGASERPHDSCRRTFFPGFRRSSAEPGTLVPTAELSFQPPLSEALEWGWDIQLDEPDFHVAVDSTAPASPPFVLEVAYTPGFVGGRSPGWAEKVFSDRKNSRIYACFWFKLSNGWQGHDSGVNKVGFIWTHAKPVVAVTAVGVDDGPLEPQLRLQDLPSLRSSGSRARNLRPNVEFEWIERGAWHLWEILLVANDWTAANGEAHWWLDGRKIGEYRDIRFAAPGQDRIWERVSIRPIWGGKGDVVVAPQSIWLDHLYVSGAR